MGRVIFGDLVFGSGDDKKITQFDGWWNVPAPDAVLVAAGGGPGAVPSGEWFAKEHYLTMSGLALAETPHQFDALRSRIVAALPATEDRPIDVESNGEFRRIWVRQYDSIDIQRTGSYLSFSAPLVAVDPFRYAPDPVIVDMGVFTGVPLYRTYHDQDGDVYRTYDEDDGALFRRYTQDGTGNGLPDTAIVTNRGDAVSRRVEIAVTGPLVAGDWHLVNETTGDRLLIDLTLTEGRTLIVSTSRRLALIDGAPLSSLIIGDWITLAPGSNTIRLASGTPNDKAFGRVTAFSAFN